MSPDYWEDALTIRRLMAFNENLASSPPADWFMAAYFEANFGWQRSSRAIAAEAQEPPEPLPLFEP